MALRDGLIAHWKLEEASGTRVDSKGANHLSTLNGAPGNAAGKLGNAIALSRASSQWAAVGDTADLSVGDIEFTFAAWVYMTANTGSYLNVLAKGPNATHPPYRMIYRPDLACRMCFYIDNGATGTYGQLGSGFTDLSVWHYVIMWHDPVANLIHMQTDNGADNSAAWSNGSYDDAGSFCIGVTPGSTDYWDGRVDEVSFWKRILTATERTKLWNNGAGLLYPWEAGGSQLLIMGFKRLLDEMKRGLLPPQELQRRWRALGAQI